MTLYFDLGNTNIKINFYKDGKEQYFNYDSKASYSVDSLWSLMPDVLKTSKVSKVLVCSVVPSKDQLIKELVNKYFDIEPTFLAYPIKTGIKIKTNDPRSTGADLVALAAYASTKFKESIVVNCGTATTILWVKDNTLEGAIIAPGIGISQNALIANASKLSEMTFEAREDEIIGKSTQEAISIGLLKGHAKMIEGLVNDINSNVPVILSGGNSNRIKHLLPKYNFVKEATIEGMKEIERINEN